MRKYLALALLATACKVEGGDIAPLKAGDGISVGDKNTISVDRTKVPLPAECASGFLRRDGDAWKCVALEQKDVKDLETTLAAKLAKDEAASTYETQAHAAGAYVRTEDADAKFVTQQAADAKYALTTDLAALEADVYSKTQADGLFATQAALGTLSGSVYTKTQADGVFATQAALATLAGEVYNKTDADARYAAKSHLHNLGDVLGVASRVDLDALQAKVDGLTKSAFQPNVPNGSCITVQHDWNTRAVGYSAWHSDPAAPGTMVAVPPDFDAATTTWAVSMPDLNTVKLCNISGTARDLSLTVWH